MKKTFFTLFFLGLAASSYAQSKGFVRIIGDGLVPCSHPFAITAGDAYVANCKGPNKDTRKDDPVPTYDCNSYIDPYSEPDRAAFCSARFIPVPQPGNDYRIGQKYAHAYASNRMVVIGVTRDIYNRTVITYQWYAGQMINEVGSFIVGVTEQPWSLLSE